VPRAECRAGGQLGQSADGAQTWPGGPEHDRVAAQGAGARVEDLGRVAGEGAVGQGGHPELEAGDCQLDQAGGAGRGPHHGSGAECE